MKFKVTFEGSTDPGRVQISDGLILAEAKFGTDAEAKLFFGLLLDMRDALADKEMRLSRIEAALKGIQREVER